MRWGPSVDITVKCSTRLRPRRTGGIGGCWCGCDRQVSAHCAQVAVTVRNRTVAAKTEIVLPTVMKTSSSPGRPLPRRGEKFLSSTGLLPLQTFPMGCPSPSAGQGLGGRKCVGFIYKILWTVSPPTAGKRMWRHPSVPRKPTGRRGGGGRLTAPPSGAAVVYTGPSGREAAPVPARRGAARPNVAAPGFFRHIGNRGGQPETAPAHAEIGGRQQLPRSDDRMPASSWPKVPPPRNNRNGTTITEKVHTMTGKGRAQRRRRGPPAFKAGAWQPAAIPFAGVGYRRNMTGQ